MDEVTEDFENSDLENLVIKDKAYKRKQLIKILIIILIIFIILLIIAIFVYFILKNKKNTYGEIVCVYQTIYNNENIVLIKNDEDLNFDLIINGIKFNQEYSHTFNNSGFQNVTFVFKSRLKSLANLFDNNKALIEADLSKLNAEDIKSMNSLFFH